jgi:hypothetical protein
MARDVERPFGDDEDANRKVASVLSDISRLSIESRKLAQTDFRNLNAELAQRGVVQGLLSDINLAADRVFVDHAEFLEAGRRMLEHRTRRKIVIHPVRQGRAGLDAEQSRLDGEVIEIERALDNARETLLRWTTRVQNLEAGLRTARLAATRHRTAQLGRAA